MLDESDWSRLARYFAGENSPAEAEATRAWIAADPERRDLAARMRIAWDDAAAASVAWKTDDAWLRLNARERKRASASRIRRYALRTPVWMTRLIAAGVLIAVGATLARLAPRRPASRASNVSLAQREYRTGPGQRAVIRLVDGTRVDLGVESALRVRMPSAAAGPGSPRELFLDGEALFTVVHAAAHPFIVHARNAVAEDIGTTFGVRAYAGDSRVRVVVVQGEVSLRPANAPAHSGTLLEAHDVGRLDSAGQTRVARGVSADEYLSWTRDRFVFRSAPLREVARHFERWYGVNIRISDATAGDELVTMDVPAGALSDAMTAATVPLRLTFTRQGDTLTIRKQ